eukprot:TRINITY_DN8357_c0_g1_i1.p1 TRINITY_DN8357_c0_g1~~TRINITY_DN8357_c0_g1_i1.p1  ORF type:complete len:412 (-),score=104.90 TRINITY_DN8357_c0_g1_i1:40-1275(-)
MSDVKDILGIAIPKEQTPSLSTILSPQKKRTLRSPSVKQRKPDGVSREVYALTESPLLSADIAPPPPPTYQSPLLLKEKRKIAHITTAWKWHPFRNPARTDGAIFHHWIKMEEDGVDDYQFARFNTPIEILQYTDAQYDQHFSKDPNWTREETDTLWKLCKQLDLRFIVIHDRFPDSNKTIEDLKERYYTISRKILELNAASGQDTSRHPLARFTFNKKAEIQRKENFNKLFNRSKEELDEEQTLIGEYKRIESELRRGKEKRKNQKQGTPNDKKRRRSRNDEEELDNEEDDVTDLLDPNHVHFKKEKSSGVMLRSLGMTTPPLGIGITKAKRMEAIIAELGIANPPLPTLAVSRAYAELKKEVITLIDLEASVAAKEHRLQLAKEGDGAMTRRKRNLAAGKVEVPKRKKK